MRQLASIQEIKSLSLIPDADKIEKAEILGWEVVVVKNEFNVGDMVIYCEIDSILKDLPPFEFMRPRGFRVKTVRLKKQISQGIAFPLSILTDIDPSFKISKLKLGQDVTEAMQITKYDPETSDDEDNNVKKSWLSNQVSYLKWKLFGIKRVKRGNFPSFVPKTDETRVQNMGRALAENEGKLAYITEKCEGQSFTCVYRKTNNWFNKLFGHGDLFLICSRNTTIFNSQTGKKPLHRLYDVIVSYNIHNKLMQLNRNLAIQGELIGPKIQKNIYNLSDWEIRVFSIFDIDNQKYLPYYDFVSVVKELDLPMVPIVDDNATIINSIKHYVELSKGKSQINPKVLREGIVVRTKDNVLSFKSINPEYLLAQK